MTRVTGYKCIFQTNEERFKFALTLAGEGAGDADFVVADPDAAETLLDMFDDSNEAHFDAESGDLTFTFDELEAQEEEEEEGEEEEEEEDEESEADSETEERASRDAANTTRAKRTAKQRSRRSAA